MNDTIPWNWQDTATIIGCVSILFLAFWIRRRLLKTGNAGGCSSCSSNESSGPTGPQPPKIIPMSSLSIGRHKKP